MDINIFFKAIASLPKIISSTKSKVESNRLSIAKLKSVGIDILSSTFESIYAHALIEYGLENEDKKHFLFCTERYSKI